MKLYIAICIDRHIDEVVRVFSTPEKAIDYCKRFMKENANYPEEIREEPINGWLYNAIYSSEGDNVRVEESELDIEEGK